MYLITFGKNFNIFRPDALRSVPTNIYLVKVKNAKSRKR